MEEPKRRREGDMPRTFFLGLGTNHKNGFALNKGILVLKYDF